MQRVQGTVVWWNDEEGWGALASPAAPSEVFAHFSAIVAEGYHDLRAGQAVEFVLEPYPAVQDGYLYRASDVSVVG